MICCCLKKSKDVSLGRCCYCCITSCWILKLVPNHMYISSYTYNLQSYPSCREISRTLLHFVHAVAPLWGCTIWNSTYQGWHRLAHYIHITWWHACAVHTARTMEKQIQHTNTVAGGTSYHQLVELNYIRSTRVYTPYIILLSLCSWTIGPSWQHYHLAVSPAVQTCNHNVYSVYHFCTAQTETGKNEKIKIENFPLYLFYPDSWELYYEVLLTAL